MRFRTRYSEVIIAILACIMVPAIILSLLPGVEWHVFALMIAVTAFIVWTFVGIKYVIDTNHKTLTSISLSFSKKVIDINEITELKYSNSWESAPAGSLKRMKVKYGYRKSVLISPYCQPLFIDMLKQINPTITIDEKLLQ